MLRFALLHHDCPPDYRDGPHWDLMLERPGVEDEHRLATWSLLELPTAWGGEHEAVAATPLADHRAAYLDYEGPVSGGRGTVLRVLAGGLKWLANESDQVVVAADSGSPTPVEISLRRTGDVWTLAVRIPPETSG